MMRSHDVRYLVGEGLRNTWQNRFMALASVGVLICCLLLTGFSYLVFANIDNMFQTAYEQNVVAVYLDVGLGDDAVEAMEGTLLDLNNVASVSFISKEEALERYGEDLPPETYESLKGDQNPLQDTYIVSLHDLEKFDDTLTDIRALDGVEDVSYDGGIASTLARVRRLVLGIGGAVVLVLLLVSLFIIANTIKLTVHNRRLEIYIMKSVGATDSFVRFPFVVEGVVLGFVAGVLAFLLIWGLYSWLISSITIGGLFGLVVFADVWVELLIGFLIGGVLVGMSGSAISMTKYLKEEGGLRP